MSDQQYLNLYKSCDIFYKWARRGMIVGQIKEKYETTRWYADLNTEFGLNDIFYPMHMYYRLPNWCRHIDRWIMTPVFGKLVGKWRTYCYRQAYLECAHKFGPLAHSIDHDELFSKDELESITTLKWIRLRVND